MLNGKRIVAVLPAYKAEKTLAATIRRVPREVVDRVLLVDDASADGTVKASAELNITTFAHKTNLGYGGNQKTCYYEALRDGADIVIMLHPDYQYDPRLVTPLAGMIAYGVYDTVLASRIIGGTALKGGMPFYKYVSNRMLTLFQNLMMGLKLSEYHTGYRAFSRPVLETLPLLANSDDFVFDNQMLAQIAAHGFTIGEISCPTKYFPEASSINFSRSVTYGLGVLATSVVYRLYKWNLYRSRIFSKAPTLRLSRYDYYELCETRKAGCFVMGNQSDVA